MRINLTTPMSDDKERQRRTKAEIDAIEQYTEKRMNDEYGRIHTDGSRSGGQPVLEPCPVPWCGSSDVKARSFDANHRRHWIECGKCNFKTLQMPSRTKAIAAWNTRQSAQSDALPAVGTEGRYVYEGMVELSCVVTAHVEGWLEVKFTLDDGEAIVRPSRFHAALEQSK